ncbi:MAG TPA: hypothetical protein VJ696_06695 [Rhodanobacteraceae bacterium]|nr:hypothetical protein [Rhodanobacteraceae bacterium]
MSEVGHGDERRRPLSEPRISERLLVGTSRRLRTCTSEISCGEQGIDLADALHLAGAESCEAFVTFDRRFVAEARKVKAGNARLLS